MKHLLYIIFFFKTFNFINTCISTNSGNNVNPTTTTSSPNIDGPTSTVVISSTATSTTTPASCSSCTPNQITFTPSTSATTEDATYSNYELDGQGCYIITAICDASDNPTASSFMQFNIDQGGPLLNGQNVITAVLNCRNSQWVYSQPPEDDRIITEVNCLRTG